MELLVDLHFIGDFIVLYCGYWMWWLVIGVYYGAPFDSGYAGYYGVPFGSGYDGQSQVCVGYVHVLALACGGWFDLVVPETEATAMVGMDWVQWWALLVWMC